MASEPPPLESKFTQKSQLSFPIHVIAIKKIGFKKCCIIGLLVSWNIIYIVWQSEICVAGTEQGCGWVVENEL